MKKLFTLFVATLAANLAWADKSGSCGANLTYTFVESTGTLTISGTGKMTDNDPWKIYDSNGIAAPWDSYRTSIKKVVVNNGVTSIGSCAFESSYNITSVTIPNSVESIGWSAFNYCTKLTSITIPNSVTSIGSGAFYNCDGLTSPLYNANVFAYMTNSDFETYAVPDGIKSIAGAAFYEANIGTLTFPNSVTNISEEAFYGAYSIGNLIWPSSVTSISDRTFKESNINKIEIPNGVTSIGDEAFINCRGLTEIEIPSSVTSIGKDALSTDVGLHHIVVKSTTPPSCNGNIAKDYSSYLYVPEESIKAYKAANEWKKFTNIESIPSTGVNEATAEKSEMKKIMIGGTVYIEKDSIRYNLNGQKVK